MAHANPPPICSPYGSWKYWSVSFRSLRAKVFRTLLSHETIFDVDPTPFLLLAQDVSARAFWKFDDEPMWAFPAYASVQSIEPAYTEHGSGVDPEYIERKPHTLINEYDLGIGAGCRAATVLLLHIGGERAVW